MATYAEVPVNIASGTRTTSGTLYTCPAGRYARVTIACQTVTGTATITLNSAEINRGDSNGARPTEWYLKSGDALVFAVGGGTSSAAYGAIEYPNP